MRPAIKRWLLNGARVAFTAAAIFFVVRKIRFEELAALFERADKGLFCAMAASLLVPLFLLALRWWLILRGHGFTPSLRQVFLVTYAGAFFSNFLPGSVGGDVAKSVLAASGEERKASVVGTVILDRVIGLAVMIVMGAGCLAPFAARLPDRKIVYLVYGLLAALIAGYLLYFNRAIRERVRRRLPFRRTMIELDGVFNAVRQKKGLVAAAAGLSFLGQALTILIIYGFGRALGVKDVGLWPFFVFEPIIFIVTAIPTSVGGWGVQEYMYQHLFFTYTGMPENEAIALSILYKLGVILVSLPGGILFAAGAARRGNPS